MMPISNLKSQLILNILQIILLFPNGTSSSNSTSLKGKHLIVLPTQLRNYMETKLNSSGHIIETNGSVPEMLNWLSARFQFDYSFPPSIAPLVVADDTPTQRGKLSYLKNNEADMYVSAMVMTHPRYQQADFPMPWLWASLGVVVPFPQSATSVGALFQPWQVEVWICLILTLPLFILCVSGLSQCFKMFGTNSGISFDSNIRYVFGVILSQGGYLRNSSLVIRLAVAGWCLACFVLIQSYSCTLTSFITVPQFAKPIIDSIYEVPKVKNLMVVTDRGLATDNLLSNADFGVFKQFGTMLKTNPELRCNNSDICIDQVKSGSRVYVALAPYLDLAIQSDYKKSGTCEITLLKERFLSSLLGFAVAKKSVYIEDLNRGILEMMQFGLVQKWDKEYVIPKKQVCHQDNNKRRTATTKKSRLSLNNLSGAFALLLIGFLLAFLVFLIEIIVRRIKSYQT